MPPVRARLVTIVTHHIAEERVAAALHTLGARGYTALKARGSGVHGHHDSGLASSGNDTFLVIVTAEVAAKILEWVETDLAKLHPSVAFACDVDAVPSGHVP